MRNDRSKQSRARRLLSGVAVGLAPVLLASAAGTSLFADDSDFNPVFDANASSTRFVRPAFAVGAGSESGKIVQTAGQAPAKTSSKKTASKSAASNSAAAKDASDKAPSAKKADASAKSSGSKSSGGSTGKASGKTPVSSKDDVKIGGATKKTGKASRGGEVAAELENLPNLNVRADDPTRSEHKPHGAALFDVQPGVSKYSELKKNPILANPVAEETVDGYKVATYQVETLPDTTIQIAANAEGIVEAIMINLNEPRSETDARKVFKEEIKDVRSIIVPDEIGNFREVFPEKGIAFVMEQSSDPTLPSANVVQLVAETVKSEYFILRAEHELQTSLTYARDDAEHALLHDPNSPGAHWILARTHLAVGDYATARKHIFKAIKLNDSLAQFHLTLIETLIASQEIDAATRYLDATRDSFVEHPLYQIEGVVLEGRLNREAKSPDYDAAITLGQRALKMVDELVAANPTDDVVSAAKRLALQANLDVALAVARKKWKEPSDQEKAFEWLDAADSLAKELDEGRVVSDLPSFRLDVWQAAFDVALEIPDSDRLEGYAKDLRAETDRFLGKTLDEVAAASARWKSGNALASAVKAFEAQKDYKQAALSGAKALEYLDVALKFRPEVDRAPLGILQAQVGEIFANGLKNDKEAEPLFDAANTLFKTIEKELKPKAASQVGAQWASLATVFWKKGKKEEGVDALKRATALLEFAAKEGEIEQNELYVPYKNLATMCKGAKDAAGAAKYAKLAESVAPKK